MPEWLLYLFLVGACYRVWRFIGKDDITARARSYLPTVVLEGVVCNWCAGSWIAVGGTYLTHHYVTELQPHWLLWAVAVAFGVGMADRLEG